MAADLVCNLCQTSHKTVTIMNILLSRVLYHCVFDIFILMYHKKNIVDIDNQKNLGGNYLYHGN